LVEDDIRACPRTRGPSVRRAAQPYTLSMEPPTDGRVSETIHRFSTIYLGGIPPIITNDSAFLSFTSAFYPERKRWLAIAIRKRRIPLLV